MTERRMGFSTEDLELIRDNYYLPLIQNSAFKQRINTLDDSNRQRNEYQRDYTRIIYSSSFRRLQGKMQLLGVQNDKFFRNRLTHSLEVGQIARSIAEDLGHDIETLDSTDDQFKSIYREDTYIVEACSLAHDIGNPPFGHKGESILHDLCNDDYGFEGNAQTLRVLMDLEKKYADFGGLNLTLRTLLGVTKYYKKFEFSDSSLEANSPPKKNEKFIYSDTYDVLSKLVIENGIKVRTLDVQIMDLSDEIAYAAHDLEDALSLNLFTMDELIYEFGLLNEPEYKYAYSELIEIVERAKKHAAKAQRMRSSEEYAYLFRKELTATIVHELIKDIGIVEVEHKQKLVTGTSWDKELGFKSLRGLAKGLKKTTFKSINRKDHVQLYEAQGKKIIMGLFEVFMEHDKYLPVEFRPKDSSKISKKRMVIDYISGMMDSFAISTYEKFYGKGSLEKIYTEEMFKDC